MNLVVKVTETKRFLVTNVAAVRYFQASAESWAEAKWNVRAQYGFWDTDKFSLQVLPSPIIDGVSEIK
jgi:hypothetical protein